MDPKDFLRTMREAAKTSATDARVTSYSGRGMYGRNCVAVTGSREEVAQVTSLAITTAHDTIVNEAAAGPHAESGETFAAFEERVAKMSDTFYELVAGLTTPSQDNMGLDVVVYWPDMIFPTDDEGEDDEH